MNARKKEKYLYYWCALGHPIPELTWWLNGNLIDSTYHTDHKDTVINHLQDYKVIRYAPPHFIYILTTFIILLEICITYMCFRQMDGAQIECKANNTLVSNPTIRSLDLEMYCKYSSKYTAYNSKCCLCASISEAIKSGYQND